MKDGSRQKEQQVQWKLRGGNRRAEVQGGQCSEQSPRGKATGEEAGEVMRSRGQTVQGLVGQNKTNGKPSRVLTRRENQASLDLRGLLWLERR